MPKGNVFKQVVVNMLTKNQVTSPPMQLYLALYSTNPTDADVGTEANYVGYMRQAVVFGNASLSNGAAVVQNTTLIQFGVVPSSSGSIAYAALRSAETGGELVYYGPLAATYQLNQGVQPMVPIGSLSVSES